MMELLIQFRLAVEVKTKHFFDPHVKQFFLPAALQKFTDDPSSNSKKAASLHITFATGYVIPGFFARLVVTIPDSPKCNLYFHERIPIFHNRVTFQFAASHVILTELPSAIQVDVLHVDETSVTEKQKTCHDVKEVLETSCQNVETCLQSPSHFGIDSGSIYSSAIPREFKFLCCDPKCPPSSYPHYLVPDKNQTCDHSSLLCDENVDRFRKPTQNEACWFPGEIKETDMLLSQPETLSHTLRPSELPALVEHAMTDDVTKSVTLPDILQEIPVQLTTGLDVDNATLQKDIEIESNEISGKLRAVNVCGEMSAKLMGDNGQCIDWPEYGFKMEIPPGALLSDDNCTIEIKAITSGHFNIPQHSEVVSSYYWIYSPRKFLKPVDVQLQHCARLSSEEDCSQMQFIIARCDQKELPYKFSIKNGVFSPNNRQGLISLTKFSILGIIRNIASHFLVEPTDHTPRAHNSCYYVFRVFGRKLSSQNTWQFDIIITKDIEPYLKAIDCNYRSGSTSWIEDIPPASIEFQDEIISISPQLEDVCQGWRYVSKYSHNIKKSFVDRCEENMTQQTCRIAFRWEGNGDPLPMDCTVQLQGAVDTPKLTLMLPIDNPTNESAHSSYQQTAFQCDMPKLKSLIATKLNDNYAGLCELIETSLQHVTREMFQAKLISGGVRDNSTPENILKEFIKGMDWIRNQSDMEERCKKFLEVCNNIGGTFTLAAKSLKEDWCKAAKQELGVSLSLE